jgi:DNA-binding GntR family transcriptional regulator
MIEEMHGPLAAIETKASQVYQRLYAMISAGQLPPGERLNVDELARELGVSKIPIREAIQRLEALGLVVQLPHAGARIAPIALRELTSVYLMRIELEALAARLAALTITDEDIERLRALNAEMRKLCDAGELDTLRAINRTFHVIIIRASGYETLIETAEQLFVKADLYRMFAAARAAHWEQVIEEHVAVIAALADRDPVAAARAIRAHVNHQVPNEIREQASQLFPAKVSAE